MKLSKKSLAGHRLTFGNGWASNGHWAAPLSRIENAGILAGSPETAAAALGVQLSEVDTFGDPDSMSRILARVSAAEPFTVSTLCHGEAPRYGRKSTPIETRIAFSAAGAVLALDRSYCALFGIEPGMILWGSETGAAFLGASPSSQDRPAPEDIAAIIMPVRFGAAGLTPRPAS